MSSPKKPALAFIFVVLALDVIGFGIIAPILPSLTTEMVGGDASYGAFTYGWLLGIYALMQFIFAPIIGALSDQFGRRRVILISLLGAGLDYFLMAWAPTIGLFFLGRVLAGITGANFSAAAAYIADISPPEKRAANFGIMGAAFGFGFVVGPALGGWLGEMNLRLPFIVAGVVTLINWLFGIFVLPESLKEENRRKFQLSKANPFSAILNLRRYPFVLGLAISFFILSLGHQVFPAIWALYSNEKFKWSPEQIGLSLALVGVMAMIVQGGLARKLIPFLGERRSALLGTGINVCSLIGFGLATKEWMLYVLIVLGALGGIATPALQGIVSRSVPDDEQGVLQGSLTSLQSVASFLGPIMMTAIFSYYVSDKVSTKIPGSGFLFAAMLTFFGLVMMSWSFIRNQKNL